MLRLWAAEWASVQLYKLPGDTSIDGTPLVLRDLDFSSRLSELMRAHFNDLFGTFAAYSVVGEQNAEDSVFRVTESTWFSLLTDAQLIGRASGLISRTQASLVFKMVNQRRSLLAKGGAGEFNAGGLYSFTFSEFLEAVVLLSLEVAPKLPAGEVLQSAQVLQAVSLLLAERLLPHVKRIDVLVFRRALRFSPAVTQALAPYRSELSRLQSRYARTVGNRAGVSLSRFSEMLFERKLIGSQLSVMQAKRAFASSLRISGEDGPADALLSAGAEFEEAILRLVRAYTPSPTGQRGIGLTPRVPKPRAAGGGASLPGSFSDDGEETAILEKIPVFVGLLLGKDPQLSSVASPYEA